MRIRRFFKRESFIDENLFSTNISSTKIIFQQNLSSTKTFLGESLPIFPQRNLSSTKYGTYETRTYVMQELGDVGNILLVELVGFIGHQVSRQLQELLVRQYGNLAVFLLFLSPGDDRLLEQSVAFWDLLAHDSVVGVLAVSISVSHLTGHVVDLGLQIFHPFIFLIL